MALGRAGASRVGAVLAAAVFTALFTALAVAPAGAQGAAPFEPSPESSAPTAFRATASQAATSRAGTSQERTSQERTSQEGTSEERVSAGEPQAPAPLQNPVLKFFAETRLTGLIDTYYSYNFNTPNTPCSVADGVEIFNCLHAFDVAHNAFRLSFAELALEKKPTSASRLGYRLDVDYGTGAALVSRFEPGGPTPLQRHIQQAYVSYLAPAGNGTLQVDFGKFVTPAGFEVIESKDDWNYSRGLLFTLAIPRYHQGLRVAYSPGDRATITGFLVNGWNNSGENNGAKSVGVQFIGKPSTALAVTVNYIGGPEIPDDNADWRHLFDIVTTYTVSPTVTIALNYDLGKELSTTWQGGAAYLRYQPNAWFALTPRYELFNDHDGWALTGQNPQEFTLTGEFKHAGGLVIRVEYRGDLTQDPFFVKNTTEQVKTQKSLTVALLYAFSSKKAR